MELLSWSFSHGASLIELLSLSFRYKSAFGKIHFGRDLHRICLSSLSDDWAASFAVSTRFLPEKLSQNFHRLPLTRIDSHMNSRGFPTETVRCHCFRRMQNPISIILIKGLTYLITCLFFVLHRKRSNFRRTGSSYLAERELQIGLPPSLRQIFMWMAIQSSESPLKAD